jgi:hypothetical protein
MIARSASFWAPILAALVCAAIRADCVEDQVEEASILHPLRDRGPASYNTRTGPRMGFQERKRSHDKGGGVSHGFTRVPRLRTAGSITITMTAMRGRRFNSSTARMERATNQSAKFVHAWPQTRLSQRGGGSNAQIHRILGGSLEQIAVRRNFPDGTVRFAKHRSL